jgi:hypothetical protein
MNNFAPIAGLGRLTQGRGDALGTGSIAVAAIGVVLDFTRLNPMRALIWRCLLPCKSMRTVNE